MKPASLKQAEIFTFLAAIFLISAVFVEKEHQENPPIIILSEMKERYRFALGSADVPPVFRTAIQTEVIPELESRSQPCQCDTIEVVGHTDRVPMIPSYSTLDRGLSRAFATGNLEGLNPGSNVDLGMLRALAIVRILKESQRAGQLRRIQFILPYSAGQMILQNNRLDTSDTSHVPEAQRRRIEIRLRKSTTRRLAN